MLFQLKLQSNPGTPRPLPIKKRRPDLKITLKKLANEPLGARFRTLFANWDALLYTLKYIKDQICLNKYLIYESGWILMVILKFTPYITQKMWLKYSSENS